MTSITPMFPGWHRKLYGRKPVKPGIEMRRKAVEISSLCLRQAKDLFGDLLATELLEKVPGFRNRSFPLPLVFRIFLCQVLAGGSYRYGVASVQALLSRHGKAICSSNTAAYCKARVRIPIRLLIRIHRHLVAAMCPRRGPRTFVVDGTTLSMPDTVKNQTAWPQSRSQKAGCGFPIMRLVGLFDLATGVWIDAATGPFRSSEHACDSNSSSSEAASVNRTVTVRSYLNNRRFREANHFCSRENPGLRFLVEDAADFTLLKNGGDASHGSGLRKQLPVQRPKLDCLQDVVGTDRFGSAKIGEGAGDFQDAVVGTGAEVHFAHRVLQVA